jgi:hypothetical protein
MPERDVLRRCIGREIDVDRMDGEHFHGRLLNVNRRSLWLVDGDEDRFVALADVATVHEV